MASPPLVHYTTPLEYREHYERIYCRSAIYTFDGIRIFFKADQFDHSFYESTQRDGAKDLFSSVRAERIDWIKSTIEHPDATLYAGWNKKTRSYSATRRVALVYENFVVVVLMGLKGDGSLKGNFVTCYEADNSIGKIITSPLWTKEECLKQLG